MNNVLAGKRITIRGIVQGVGFRPFVYSIAIKNQLTGWVRNTSAGVEIEGWEDAICHSRGIPAETR